MKKALVVMALLAAATVANAAVVDVFTDDFESYLDASEISLNWTGSYSAWSETKSVSPTHSIYNDAGAVGKVMSHNFDGIVGTDANPLKLTFQYYDITGTGGQRQTVNFLDTSAGLAQKLQMGQYNTGNNWVANRAATTAEINTYYMARITNGTNSPAWFILIGTGAPTRSIGWHEMAIVITSNKIDFLVDGVSAVQGIAKVQNFTQSGMSYDQVQVGSGLSSGSGAAYFDDIKVQILPEPVSALFLAVGALFLRRRHA